MKKVPIVVAMLALAACDVGLSGISIAPPRETALPTNAGGIWEGSITDDTSGSTSAIAGVITETGVNPSSPEEGRFVDEQGNQIVFTTVSGGNGSVVANVTAFSPPGAAFADGSTVATGLFDGSVVERSSLDGSLTLNLGTGAVTSTVSMSYNADYERGSDRARIEGVWADSFGVIYNVDALGITFAQDAGGCVYDGRFSVIFTEFNAYRLRLTVSDCAELDGDYLGLGVLGDDAGVDDAFVIHLDNTQIATFDVLLKQ